MGVEPPPELGKSYPKVETPEGWKRIYPISKDGSERVWRVSYNSPSLHTKELNDQILCSSGGTLYQIVYGKKEPINSNWTDKRYNAGTYGTNVIKNMLGDASAFSYPKSLYTVEDFIKAVTSADSPSIILDFFAGSGTTAHAVMDLNLSDSGKRKYILVEMGTYYDTATRPRVKKAIYATDIDNWKDGKPLCRTKGYSSIVKCIDLESYEDALSNVQLSEENKPLYSLFGEDYLIHYMLDIESRGSLLDLEQFKAPFSYQMKITERNETKKRPVDLVETFNYLIGISVARQSTVSYFRSEPDTAGGYEGAVRLMKDDGGEFGFKQVEGTLPDGRRALVIWRTVTDDLLASNAALDAYFTKHRINPHDREFDVIYVNGDNNLENLRTGEESWKVQMTEIEFKNRMFEEV